jgi:hypothetical protein
MASMTVLVMKEVVNHENFENFPYLFVLNHAFSRQLPESTIGTRIMMQDIGVRYRKGQTVTLDEKNHLRQEAVVEQRTKIMKKLNTHRVTFSERALLVLAQPEIDEPDLYWKSIEDFL